MPIEHPHPTEATVKYLYAHAFRCAYPGCPRWLYRQDEQTGARILNSRVCHINARREGGPRWDENQSPEDNRSEQNLILMCVEHASTIDDLETRSAYPPGLLLEWKAKQFEEFDRLKQGWAIDQGMAQDALRASEANASITIANSTVHLGGEGGRAPGAGGGGGGAIGREARAGRGGDGGSHRVDNGEFSLPFSEAHPPFSDDEIAALIEPGTDSYPGAGGGGGGAIGDGARGGDGGHGGERVSGLIDIEALRKLGFTKIRATVGKGGSPVNLPGAHAESGEDSLLEFVTDDGLVLKTIRAAAGLSGRSASSYLPDGVLEISPEDLQAGFRITTLMVARGAEFSSGSFFIMGVIGPHEVVQE